jgi:hypothetical protein
MAPQRRVSAPQLGRLARCRILSQLISLPSVVRVPDAVIAVAVVRARPHDPVRMVLVGAAQLDAGARALQKPPLFSAFSYVCPEPVLVD